jgi:hypothetical protein
MVRRALLLCMLLGGGAVQADAGTLVQRYEGRAHDLDSGRLLYTEQHLVQSDASGDSVATTSRGPDRRLVLYRCPAGQLFARKLVEYATGSWAAPVFTLQDGRFGYREGVRAEAGKLFAFLQRDAESEERNGVVEPGERLVIDAGFDEFVRASWERLQSGETLSLDFLVPSRLTTYGFKLRRVGPVEIEGAAATQFRLGLGGMLGWFAPDITVTYRDADQRLLRFEGLTNIRADREDNLVARIEFPAALGPRPAESGDWDSALAEPLSACEPGR